jgi:hypothetical protein
LKFSKIIGLILAVTQLASATALILGMHTIIGVFSSAMPSDGQSIDIEYTDPVKIPIVLNPTNNGYLNAKMNISIKLIVDNIEVASDLETLNVQPGSTTRIELLLTIPLSEAQKYFNTQSDIQFETDISVHTLFDLISFGNKMLIEGGAQ